MPIIWSLTLTWVTIRIKFSRTTRIKSTCQNRQTGPVISPFQIKDKAKWPTSGIVRTRRGLSHEFQLAKMEFTTISCHITKLVTRGEENRQKEVIELILLRVAITPPDNFLQFNPSRHTKWANCCRIYTMKKIKWTFLTAQWKNQVQTRDKKCTKIMGISSNCPQSQSGSFLSGRKALVLTLLTKDRPWIIRAQIWLLFLTREESLRRWQAKTWWFPLRRPILTLASNFCR